MPNATSHNKLAEDPLHIAGFSCASRLFLGTARYPSPSSMSEAITAAAADIITVSLRRESFTDRTGQGFWDLITKTGARILPNTAGCHTVKEAVLTAHMARELFNTTWIKLEVIGHTHTLQPDPFALVEAARILIGEGFQVFPYTTEDLIVAERLYEAGCRILMPWGSPIGSGQGIRHPAALRLMRQHFSEAVLVVDAGIGAPSHAAQAMELGYDAVLVNTAVASAHDPVSMAQAFRHAVIAGRQAYRAGLMRQHDLAQASSPSLGLPIWHEGDFS